MIAAGTLLLAGAMGIGRFAYTPLLPAMQDVLGWSVSRAGDVASANFLGYLVGALLASALSKREARWGWLVAGMILSVATTGGGAFITSYSAWLVLRFLSGVASAFCLVLGTVVILEHLARSGAAGFGALHFSGVGAGIVVSVVVIELAKGAGLPMSGRWGALGSVCVLLIGGAWLVLRRLPGRALPSTSVVAPARDAAPASNPLLFRLILAYGLFGFGYVVTATFIVAMARRLEHSALAEPLTWIVVGLLAAPSVPVWQRVARRIGVFAALRFAFAFEAAGVLLAGYGSGHAALVLGGALLGGTFAAITAIGLAAARQIAGRHEQSVVGWMTASFGLGQLVGPAAAGRLADYSGGFEAPSLVAATLLIIGVVLLLGAEKSLP
ncbi:MAG: YbfB/YjiJ family MFS transporter [Gammaproteobacteria bacterium]|nr:YbfB/YjiJ family MFS transporter [Gammaproteobacteria bacterium]